MIATQNPGLFQQISQNQQEFMDMLEETGTGAPYDPLAALEESLNLTQEDKDAIDRVSMLSSTSKSQTF